MKMAEVLTIAMTARAIRSIFVVDRFTIFEAKMQRGRGKVILFPDPSVKAIILETLHTFIRSNWQMDC